MKSHTVKKQATERRKKPTTGERAVSEFHQNGDMTWAQLIRRIDRAISAAVRKERGRCAGIVNDHAKYIVAQTIIREINRP